MGELSDSELFEEAKITINGLKCSMGEALTLRVAMESFARWLNDKDNKKSMGEIGEGYRERIEDLRAKIYCDYTIKTCIHAGHTTYTTATGWICSLCGVKLTK